MFFYDAEDKEVDKMYIEKLSFAGMVPSLVSQGELSHRIDVLNILYIS